MQVGTEKIGYGYKDRGTLTGITRGIDSTSAAAHKAGDQMRLIDPLIIGSGQAIDSKPITRIELVFKTGQALPTAFKIYGYKWDIQPRTPDPDFESDTFYLRDFELVALSEYGIWTVTAETTTWSNTLATATRYRWVHVVVTAVSPSPARVQLAELRVYTDTSVEDPDTCIPDGDVYDMVAAIAALAGLPSGAVVDGGDTLELAGEFTSEPGTAWQVLADLADMTGSWVRCERDSKLLVYGVPPIGDPADLDMAVVAKFQFAWQSGQDVSQVELTWQAPDNSAKGTVWYPAEADPLGSKVVLGPKIFADAAAALAGARAEYWQARRKYEAVLELAQPTLTPRPGDDAIATWQIDDAAPALARACQVSAASFALQGGRLDTVLHVVQTDGESER